MSRSEPSITKTTSAQASKVRDTGTSTSGSRPADLACTPGYDANTRAAVRLRANRMCCMSPGYTAANHPTAPRCAIHGWCGWNR